MHERIEENLLGSEQIKRRRVEMLTELTEAHDRGGPQAVTNNICERMEKLAGVFGSQLQEMKKQL